MTWRRKQKFVTIPTANIANSQVQEDELINLNKNYLSGGQEEIKKCIQRQTDYQEAKCTQ